MKMILALILAVASMASYAKGTNTNSRLERMRARRAEHRAKLAAMTPEEREARVRRKAALSRAEKKENAAKVAERYRAAKEACQDCYRVVVTNGVWVGMTKSQYEAYQQEKAEEAKRDREIMQDRKSRKRTPRPTPRKDRRKRGKSRK